DQIKIFFEKVNRDDVLTEAAALSYSTALAIAPMVMLLIALLSFMRLDLQDQFLEQTRNLMGDEASQVFESIVNSANNRTDLSALAGWVSAVVLAFSAAVVFSQLQSALNIIFKADATKQPDSKTGVIKNFIFRRLLSMGILLSFLFISMVSLVVSSVLSYLTKSYELAGVKLFSAVVNLFVYTVLFAMLYRWMPDRSAQKSKDLIAGFLTAIMFAVGKTIIGTYIGQTAVGSAYGAAGSLVVLLVWIYYSALVFLLGAEISSLYLLRKK
ncbi:MAG: YihY/virulence factor BrkB family protein, partial [Pseudobdellovibrio sp.]